MKLKTIINNSNKSKTAVKLPTLDVKATLHRKMIEKVNIEKYLRRDETSKPSSYRESLSSTSTTNNSYHDSGKKSSLSNKQLISVPLPYNFKRANERTLDINEKKTDFVVRKYSKLLI